MRAKEFIVENVSAEKVVAYVNTIHPTSQKTSNLDQIILANKEYVLKTVPVSSLQIDADEDPHGRVVHVDVDYADDITPEDIKRKPIVIDTQGHILDGNHRAWQARELGITHIPAYVPVAELTESLDPEVEEFLNDLTPDDVGVDEVGDYRVHFEGFTDDCQSSRAYRRNPEAVFQEVWSDFIRREGGRQPVAAGMVGDEDYPILYSVFKNTELTESLSISTQKQGKKFATQMTLDNKPIGSYEYDERTGRSLAEILPEYQGKGYGKILVLHAVYTAGGLIEDESRTAAYNNVLDSLWSEGLIVEDDGYWYCTEAGEEYLNNALKESINETDLNYQGNCTDDDVIEYIFGDATTFAQLVDEHGDEFEIDDLVVKYNPEEDIHYFYYRK